MFPCSETNKYFYTQTLLQTNASTHKHSYKYTTLHTDDAYTHGPFHTQTLLHTEAFKQKSIRNRSFYFLYTEFLIGIFLKYKNFYLQKLLHATRSYYIETLIQTSFHIQKPLYTQIPFYKTILYKETFYA